MFEKELYDPDVVAYLYGESEEDSLILLDAIQARNNPSTLLKTSTTAVAVTQTLDATNDDITTREDEDQKTGQACKPCFKVTFSEPPTRKGGFVIGSDSNAADLVVKYGRTVSARQFALVFDKEHELMVEDLSSTNGTRVVYCHNNADEERPVTEASCGGIGMTWSACGPSMMGDTRPVIIVAKKLKFRLVVPNHNKTSKEYQDNVARFMQGQSEVVAVEGLSLKTKPATALALPTHRVLMSAREGLLPTANGFWQKRLSSGATSVVDYVWNVTTRSEFAIKRPKETMDGNNDLEAWKNEAHVLNGLNHPNIVRLLKTEPEPHPQLHFEYSPYGTLQDCIPNSTTHLNKQVACQLLAALKYLDAKANGRCFAHCDIKPANVLVHALGPDSIQVKLCGFGLAKAVNHRQERKLGTAPYHTSAIDDGDSGNDDDLKADLWSLGILLVQLECRGLPPPDKSFSERVIEFARQNNTSTEPNSLLSFVLETMLKTDPHERLSASECLAMAEDGFKVDSPPLPWSDNDAAEGEGIPIVTTPKATEEPDLTFFRDREGNGFMSRLLPSTGKTMMRGRVLRSESPGPSCQQLWDATGKICATMERTQVWPIGNLELTTEDDITSESGSQDSLELERAEISTPLESESPSEDGTVVECENQEGVYLGRVGMADLDSRPAQEPGSERHTRSKRKREERADAEYSHPVVKRLRTDESVERELYRQLEEADALAEEEDARAEEEDAWAQDEEVYFADEETCLEDAEACVKGEEASATNCNQFV